MCKPDGIHSAIIQFIHDQVKGTGAEFGFRFMSSACGGLVQNLVQTSAERAPF